MSVMTAVRESLQGKTSLSRVFWAYGVLGSLVYSALGLLINPENALLIRVYGIFGFLFDLFVTVATYQCAANCQSKSLARFVRISAVLSLVVLLPVCAYLEFTGTLGFGLPE